MRRGDARRQSAASSGCSSAARAIPTATTSSSDGPPPPDPLPFTVDCPKNHDGHLVPRRARRTGNVFWGCSNYPKCDYTTNNEPLGGLHDTDDGPIARKGEAAICLVCGSTIEAAPDAIVPGERYPGGPANPEALARPARGGARGGGGTRRRAGAWGTPLGRPCHDPADATRRTGRRRVSGVALDRATPSALARFLRTLAARDASPHTQRSYATAIGAYLDWLVGPRRRLADAPREPTCGRTSRVLGDGRARSSVAQRLAAIRSFHRWADPDGAAPGDPWGAIATPRLPGRLPRVLEVDEIGALLDVVDRRPRRGRPRRLAGPHRAARPPWRCATGRWSRPPTPRACASASSPRRTSGRSTSGAARYG